jgi:tetratricopeptide (TPR) repeat protein
MARVPDRLASLALVVVASFALGAPHRAGAQTRTVAADTTDPLGVALSAEEKGDPRLAATSYRLVVQRALASGSSDADRLAVALLGLERVWAELGMRDSILPVVQRVLMLRPSDPIGRSIQLRTLVGLGRDEDARLAFIGWRRATGNDGAPFREYARLLLAAGRAQAADSLLAEAGRTLGASSMLSGEVAQLHVALSRWNAAAVAFRAALADQPYLETAALFALGRAPVEMRDSIRAVLNATPVVLGPRRLLSSLELTWGEPRRAWAALSSVTADDSTAAAWRAFGERAEMSNSWLVARDAWTAVFERRGDLESQARAASAASSAGDAAGALELARRPAGGNAGGKEAERIRALVPVEIAALGDLGRAAEAQQRLDAVSKGLDESTRAEIARPLVGAWLRSGDLDRARAAVAGNDLADDDETAGWLALYEGDLATARKRLVRAESRRGELVDALGLLARARIDRSPALGQAFLALARRDSADAARRFIALADSAGDAPASAVAIGDAAPALLALAARIQHGAAALTLWDRIVSSHPKSPEAPEALLLSARAVRDAGDRAGAIVRLEKLLVEYPESALLPQARRDLERLRGQVPPYEFS